MHHIIAYVSDKIRSHYACLSLCLLIFLVFFIFNQSNLLSSDSATYTLIVRHIAENRSIPSHIPYEVVDVSNGNVIYYPICYPLLPFLLTSGFYAMGGEMGLDAYSGMFAGIFAFVVYVFVSKFSDKKRGLLAAGTVFFSRHIFGTFARTILLEQLLLVFIFLALYFYTSFLKTNERKYAVYSGIALGLTLATKQSGLLFATSFFSHTILYGVHRIRSNKRIDANRLRNWLLLYGIAALVSAPFLLYLILDTGTLDYPVGQYFWFLKPKWTPDSASLAYLGRFWPLQHSTLIEKTYATMTYVFYTLDHNYLVIWEPLCYIIFLFLGLGIWYLYKKDKLLLSTFGVFIAGDFCFSILSGGPPRYFVLAYSLVMIMIALGTFQLFSLINRHISISRSHAIQYVKTPLIVLCIICLCLVSFAAPNYFHSLYESYYHGTAKMPEGPVDRTLRYKVAAEWVSQNTPEDALFLASRYPVVAYYWKRQATWVNILGMGKVPEILYSRDLQLTMFYLRTYGIDYIVYDPYHVYVDYFPPGLSDFFRYGDPHFKLVYADDIPFLKIYKIVYDESIPIYPTRIAEESSVRLSLDKGLDAGVFYPNVRAICAHPSERWNLTYIGLRGTSEYNYMTISLSPDVDRDNDGYVDKPIILAIEGIINEVYVRVNVTVADQWSLIDPERILYNDNLTQIKIDNAEYTKVENERWIEPGQRIVHSYVELLFSKETLIKSITISFLES